MAHRISARLKAAIPADGKHRSSQPKKGDTRILKKEVAKLVEEKNGDQFLRRREEVCRDHGINLGVLSGMIRFAKDVRNARTRPCAVV